MEFLSQLDDNKQQRELIESLENKKLQLQQKLQNLENELQLSNFAVWERVIETVENKKMQLQQQLQNLQNELSSFDSGFDTPGRSHDQTLTAQCRQVIETYRYIGVSTKHTQMKEDSLVLQFDPLYKGQAPSCDCYYAEIKMTSNGHQLGQHNIPPFIPVKQFTGQNLSMGSTKQFVQETQNYLQSYVQRREGIKHVQVEYKDQGITKVEIDLPVTHIKVNVSVDKDWPDLTVTLNYNLSEVTPNMVSIDIDDSTELRSKNKDKLYRLITIWKTKFIQQDLYTAFTEMLKDLKKM